MTTSTVREAMTTSPTTVAAQESAVEAARLMAARDVGSLPVLDGDDLVGMVTDRDLVLHVLAKDVDPHKVTMASICSEDPIVVGSGDSLDDLRAITGPDYEKAIIPEDRLPLLSRYDTRAAHYEAVSTNGPPGIGV